MGVGAAVPPGPVNLEIARRVAAGGFWGGASVGLGAVTVDVLLAALLTLGVLAAVQATDWVRVPVAILGVALLTYLGLLALRSLRTRLAGGGAGLADESTPPVAAATPVRGYLTGLLLCGTSPYQAAFWLFAVPTTVDNKAITTPGKIAVCVGVLIATLAWVALFSTALSLARSLDRRRWLPIAMDAVGGATLLGFAIWSAWSLGRALLYSAPPVAAPAA